MCLTVMMIVLVSLSVFKRHFDETSGVYDGFRNCDGDMDCGNDNDWEFPCNCGIDAHVIDPESVADGVFQNAIEEVHSLKRTGGCEGDKGVATHVEDIDDEREGHTIDINSDGFVLRRSKRLVTTTNTFRYSKL